MLRSVAAQLFLHQRSYREPAAHSISRASRFCIILVARHSDDATNRRGGGRSPMPSGEQAAAIRGGSTAAQNVAAWPAAHHPGRSVVGGRWSVVIVCYIPTISIVVPTSSPAQASRSRR